MDTGGSEEQSVTIIVCEGRQTDWGVLASRVIEVVLDGQWHEVGEGTSPLDVAAALGIESPPSEARRVLLLRTNHGDVAISMHGKVSMRTVRPDAVRPLPTVLGRVAEHVSGIVLAEGVKPIFVLDPDRVDALAFQPGK